MSDESNSTIKFGAGFDAPWIVVRGTVDEQKTQVGEAFGLEVGDKTLAELVVEASTWARSLYDAAFGVGKRPAQGQNGQGPASASEAAVQASRERQTQTPADIRASIEDKVAEADTIPDDPAARIAGKIHRAQSKEDLYGVRRDAQAAGTWTENASALARQRLAELEGQKA